MLLHPPSGFKIKLDLTDMLDFKLACLHGPAHALFMLY